MTTRILSSTVLFVSASFLCGLTGCSQSAGDVTGVVTYNGKPLATGNVCFVGPDGIPRTGLIGPTGSYSVSGVGVGTAKVTVSSPNPNAQASERGGGGRKAPEGRGSGAKGGRENPKLEQPEPSPADAALAKQWVAIPELYSDPMKSNLSTLVKSGSNTYNIELK